MNLEVAIADLLYGLRAVDVSGVTKVGLILSVLWTMSPKTRFLFEAHTRSLKALITFGSMLHIPTSIKLLEGRCTWPHVYRDYPLNAHGVCMYLQGICFVGRFVRDIHVMGDRVQLEIYKMHIRITYETFCTGLVQEA